MVLVISSQAYHRLTTSLYYILIGLVIVSIGLLIFYQASYIAITHKTMPFLEPDNYEYYMFAQLALTHPTLTPYNITNPYLINAPQGFFEHPGLYLMPVYLYYILHLPLIWEFRILQILAVACIYIFGILILRKCLMYLPIAKEYHWLSYTIVISSFLLMQYTEITEWRGTEFIAALSLISVYLMAWAWTNHKFRFALIPLILIEVLAMWIWSGGFVVPLLVAVGIIVFSIYSIYIKKHPNIWRYVALATVISSILIFFFAGSIEGIINSFTAHFGFNNINPLHIGELEGLSLSNGLVAILMMLVFSSFSLAAFLGNTIMSTKKKEYEYYLVGMFVASLLFLPLALIYIRLISLIAPFLSVLYALGIVAMLSYFSKTGSNRIVLFATIILILIGSVVGQYIFYISTTTLYSFSNPIGLINATAYMDRINPNASVLTYYSYGDYLEEQGHLHTYADTIQGLNYSKILYIDKIFESNATTSCQLIRSINPKPYFIMVSSNMLNSTLFENTSTKSILKDYDSFNNTCGYKLVYSQGGFEIFKG